jgi:hypothetical protein
VGVFVSSSLLLLLCLVCLLLKLFLMRLLSHVLLPSCLNRLYSNSVTLLLPCRLV